MSPSKCSRKRVPNRLFPIPLSSGVVVRDEYAPSANGTRFLVSRAPGDAVAVPITVVVNWRASQEK